MIKSNLLNDLNNEQLEAVTHKEGPLLIIAGAGTGKTTVITHRIAWLIEQKVAKPNEILALTFTEKAAQEMEERVDVLVPYGYVDMWISTFHAFGDRILRDEALNLGLPTDFEVLTQPQQAMFIKEHLFVFELEHFRPLSNPTKHIEALIKFFSRLKDELIAPEEYLEWLKTKNERRKAKRATNNEQRITSHETETEYEKQRELARAYRKYQELLGQEGKIDFGDQIMLLIKLFKKHPKILKKYQEQFKYILVDEFQDTNWAQNELIKILTPNHNNITVVGDDDQSIYKFRGAAISNILDFSKVFPGAKKIVLVKNYRSPQPILDSAYQLIQHNNPDRLEIKAKIDKKLRSNKKGGLPEVIQLDSLASEVQKVGQIIEEGTRAKEYNYKDFAILARANDHLEPFIQELNRLGIPHQSPGSKGLYDQEEIKLLINFLKSIAQPTENLPLFYLATSEIYQIDPWQMAKLGDFAKKNNRRLHWLFENIHQVPSNIGISGNTKEIIHGFTDDLKRYTEIARQKSAGQLLYQFLKDKDYLAKLVKEESTAAEIKIKNISRFFSKISQFNYHANDRSAYNFVGHLDLLTEFGEEFSETELNPDMDAVNVLTVHGAKGLEFPVVIMVNLATDRFPARRRSESIEIPEELIKESLPEGDYHLEEERRLFYVGMTRTQKRLYLTCAKDYGGLRTKKPSQFLLELSSVKKIEPAKIGNSALRQIELFSTKETPVEIQIKMSNFYREGKLVLSPYKIDDYSTCPLKFKYIHILEIPISKNYTVMYGAAIHKAIEYYFKNKLIGRTPPLDDLTKIYKDSWDPEGFITREHEERKFKKGINALAGFYHKQKQEKRLPVEVEKGFSFRLDDILVRGRYDIIYIERSRAKDQKPKIEISDFKTSEIENQEKADERVANSNQILIYALAYQEIEGKIPDKLTFQFIESDLVGEARVDEKKIEKIKSKIKETADGIKKADFRATPSYSSCRYCAYKSICPYKTRGA